MTPSQEQNKTPEERPFKQADLRALPRTFHNCYKVLSELQENENKQHETKKVMHEQNKTIDKEIGIITNEPNWNFGAKKNTIIKLKKN